MNDTKFMLILILNMIIVIKSKVTYELSPKTLFNRYYNACNIDSFI